MTRAGFSGAAEPYAGIATAMRVVDTEIDYAARSDAKVLITGESGVGKEIVARLIHQRGRRRATPLVTANCAGIPDSLLESSLFGLFEMANGGTIFLDEIGEMSLRVQTSLLRFLENGAQRRVDARVMAATSRPLMELIESKDFREDLYYRLNVIHIAMPPLRERREDIPGFFQYFLEAYATQRGMTPPRVPPETLQLLVRYDWRGNVRELKNVAERITVPDGFNVVMPDDLPIEIRHWSSAAKSAAARTTSTERPSKADACFARMIDGHESFWTVVHPVFMSRDLTRDHVRAVVGQGLERTRGSYKLLVELFNMPPSDYKRFLNFLRKHDCQVAFQRYRAVSNASSTLPGRRPNAP